MNVLLHRLEGDRIWHPSKCAVVDEERLRLKARIIEEARKTSCVDYQPYEFAIAKVTITDTFKI